MNDWACAMNASMDEVLLDARGLPVPDDEEVRNVFLNLGGQNGRRVFLDEEPDDPQPGDATIYTKPTPRPEYPDRPTPRRIVIVVAGGNTITSLAWAPGTGLAGTLYDAFQCAVSKEAMYWLGWGDRDRSSGVGEQFPLIVRRKQEPDFRPGTLVIVSC